MLNCCMRGCSKAVGLTALSFGAGVIAGAFSSYGYYCGNRNDFSSAFGICVCLNGRKE